jgi:hypothetical protein
MMACAGMVIGNACEITDMMILLLIALLILVWVVYKSIDWFEKI